MRSQGGLGQAGSSAGARARPPRTRPGPRSCPHPRQVAVVTSLPHLSLTCAMPGPGGTPGVFPGVGSWDAVCGRALEAALCCVPECQLWATPPGGTKEGEAEARKHGPQGAATQRGEGSMKNGDQRQDRPVLALRDSFLEWLGTVPVLKPACAQHGACGHCCQPLAPPPPKRIILFLPTETNKQNKQKESEREAQLRRAGARYEGLTHRRQHAPPPEPVARESTAPRQSEEPQVTGTREGPTPLSGSGASSRNPLLKRESPGVSPKMTCGEQGCSCLLSGLQDI